MKATLYDLKGEKKSEVQLPEFFDMPVREDIVAKYLESYKLMNKQLHAPYAEAGKRHSASGTISHRRHEWKGHYGKGISRVPRKAMWRRGTQFYWVAAEVAGTRGGRRAHPPRAFISPRKVNDKEIKLAMLSALAATANEKFVTSRYASIDKLNVKTPVIVEKLDGAKSKDVIAMLKKVFGDISNVLLQTKEVRAGSGKSRGRRYKSNAGLLVIKGSDEKFKMSGVDVITWEELEITDLYPLGRLSVFTQKALEELKNVA